MTTKIADLARGPRGALPLKPYMLDAPHEALRSLTLALCAATVELPGLLAVNVTASGRVITAAVVAVLPGGLPVSLAAALDVSGLPLGGTFAVIAAPDPVTEPHAVTVARVPLVHDMTVREGVLRILAAPGLSLPELPTGALLVAQGSIEPATGNVTGLVVEPPTARLRGAGAMRDALARAYSLDRPVPLSDGFGADVPVPEDLAYSSGGGFGTAGVWADFTPTADAYLSGLHNLHQIGNGESHAAYIWDVAAAAFLGATAPATVTGGQCVVHWPAPIRLRAGRAYRIAWSGAGGPASGMSGQNNTVQPVYPGFSVSRMYDNYDARFEPANTSRLPQGNQYGWPTWRLLLAGDFKASGVTGRLQPGALPRSASPLALADGQAYILAAPGVAPELRMREAGTEYRVAGVPV